MIHISSLCFNEDNYLPHNKETQNALAKLPLFANVAFKITYTSATKLVTYYYKLQKIFPFDQRYFTSYHSSTLSTLPAS
jgi:hypothetical protein